MPDFRMSTATAQWRESAHRPLIAKGLDLFRQRTPGLVFIDSVVGPIRVEGRVEVNQVRAARTQFILHNSQAIVVIKLIAPAHASALRIKQAEANPLLYLQPASAMKSSIQRLL
ncbi:MAG: hypothetical protein M2R46_04502 [Verrucomicrobia subdivision 3 bacterium]|nr:hypothetical protein [Limisphaerales bacterium]